MRSLVKTETSTETRLSWWAYLFVLDEFIAEADATINGPASFNNTPPALSDRRIEPFYCQSWKTHQHRLKDCSHYLRTLNETVKRVNGTIHRLEEYQPEVRADLRKDPILFREIRNLDCLSQTVCKANRSTRYC